MKLRELISLEENHPLGELDIKGVTCDSRVVREDYAFVCIDGVKVDGHKFAASAVKSGASVIIAEKDTGLENQIIVENCRQTYALMCAAFFGHPAEKLEIIGVTGTNGKTTTTTLIKSILESQGCKVGLIGTVQNMVGEDVLPAKSTTPDAFELHSLFALMLKAGCDYVVMEVSSHAIDQDRVYGLEFAVCVFTNLTQDHLDYHHTMENYLKTKKKIFYRCKKSVINLDDKYADEFINASDGEVFTYSAKSDNSSFSAKNIRYLPHGVDFELVGDGVIGRAHANTPGSFSVYNALAAAVTVIALGFSFNGCLEGLAKAPGVKGRAEVVPTGLDFTVIIDYAHTPDGLKNIISALNALKKGRLITLFGCGGDRDKGKRPEMGRIAAENSDYVIVTSDNPRTENPGEIISDIMAGVKGHSVPYKVIENREQAVEYAIKNARTDDIVLLAGKGHETYQIIGTSAVHLDEREIVARVAAEIKAKHGERK